MKRPLDDDDDAALARNESSKPIFVRDAGGELVRVMPGEALPAKAKAATDDSVDVVEKAQERAETARLAARSEEEIQYEAYLGNRDAKRGSVWIANVNQASSNRAAFTDSIAAQIAEERAASGESSYAPARAYDRGSKVKKASGGNSGGAGGSYGGSMSLSCAREGASAAAEALARAREASDDDDDDEASLRASAAQVASKAMQLYNLPISNLPQLDTYGNDLRVPQLERKLRKFLECFGEEAHVTTLEGQSVLKDFESIRKRYSTVFRESGSTLRAELLKRFEFERPSANDGDGAEDEDEDEDEDDFGDDGVTYCLDFTRHT